MMKGVEKKELRRLIDYLQGTCKSLAKGCDVCEIEEDDLSKENLEDLENEIFHCDSCGWWCGASESNDGNENICTDCYDDYINKEEEDD
ncbi:MAG: hypothetical protein ACOH2V_00835 [Candidatus Saccharimonadaceae bacterium]